MECLLQSSSFSTRSCWLATMMIILSFVSWNPRVLEWASCDVFSGIFITYHIPLIDDQLLGLILCCLRLFHISHTPSMLLITTRSEDIRSSLFITRYLSSKLSFINWIDLMNFLGLNNNNYYYYILTCQYKNNLTILKCTLLSILPLGCLSELF